KKKNLIARGAQTEYGLDRFGRLCVNVWSACPSTIVHMSPFPLILFSIIGQPNAGFKDISQHTQSALASLLLFELERGANAPFTPF
ncbi:hypothetical protein AAEZ66_00030, partial [Vibrio cholerae]|uniref:hypothetical protein n=1 Tax=Vibrio cholerae TaxID=666 RepID=UPI00313CC83F